MSEIAEELKSVPLAKGIDAVFYPGEIEARNDARYRREGLMLPADTISDLVKIAKRCGLSFKPDR
jgi:LDH2 family malate/lactate/ureidoglycolate dehydrogenase